MPPIWVWAALRTLKIVGHTELAGPYLQALTRERTIHSSSTLQRLASLFRRQQKGARPEVES